jgi:hypothetical protein
MAAKAMTPTITLFVRMTSPYQFHGNMGFMDAVSLVRAPLSALEEMPARIGGRSALRVAWYGEDSPDVKAMGGTYVTLYDVQTRAVGRGEWRDLVVGASGRGETQFVPRCEGVTYEFRVRARAEQPEGGGGVWPNQRYPGVWSKPVRVLVDAPPAPSVVPAQPTGPEFLYIPAIRRDIDC